MASPRKNVLSGAALAALGLTGYYLYSVFAAQGQGTLAQAPLNIQSSVTPAFIMGVDDSGSMSTDETLFRTGQGLGYFRPANYSFFDDSGVPYESGGVSFTRVVTGADNYRADLFGAARAPQYNRAYFNPAVNYLPWRKSDGTFENDSSFTDAPEDPRPGYNDGNVDFSEVETSSYTFRKDMRLHAGTRYRNNNKCNNSPTPGTGNATNSWITLNADIVFAGDCSTQFEYIRGVVYLGEGAAPPPGFDLSARELIEGAGPAGANLYKYEYKLANFTTGGAAALTNFANWWTYYGNRNRAMIAGMTQSMSDVTNMRVGYFEINDRNNVTMYNVDVATEKASLYGQMRALNSSGNTPTRRATAHMASQFRRKNSPGKSDAPVQLVCQKNAGMLFTDGYTNDDPVGGIGNVDGALPAPFGGGVASSGTIADIAMDAYLGNLRPDLLAGKVPVPSGCDASNPDPRLDCQKDLHMNFYGITLGARGAIYDVDSASTSDPYVNPPSWGATGSMNLDPRNVDDIWHATINSRGEFINAQSPTDITEAMRRILASVGGGTTPSGTIALTGSRIGTGSLTVIPEYTATNNSTDWYSTLTAQTVTSTVATGVTYTTLWEASSKLPGARDTIWIAKRNGGNVKPTVSKFDDASLTREDLCSDPFATCTTTGSKSIAAKLGVTAAEAIAYLKGDPSLEVVGTGGKLRKRTTRLGDIVNSTPVVASPTDDFGYRSLRTSATVYDSLNYKDYLESKKTRATMVYAGANDGMLHAFHGTTGVEQFAYIPTTSWGHMGNLLFPYNAADKNFQVFDHRYYVDGPINISDVHDGAWKTMLVGTSGAGGRSVFAIDVTDPTVFNSSKLLWELNDTVTSAVIKNNIGHVLGKPLIVPVKEGTAVKWKAIFGNGYGSVNGVAALFVVDISTGSAQVITASESGGPSKNGLGNIVAIDRYDGNTKSRLRDGLVDTVYGGDQNGAVWKFDLRSPSTQTKPFFTATDKSNNRQAILGGFEAASGPGGGVMIYFGTGSFSFVGDPDDKQLQTVYGVLDTTFGVDPGTDPVTMGRSLLQQQRVKVDTNGNRELTTDGLTFGKKGWLLDLGVTTTGGVTTATGERSVGNPVITSGVVFFPTFDPNTTDTCAVGGLNRLYGLNALSGGGALSQARVGAPDGALPAAGTGAIKLASTASAPIKDVVVMTTPRGAPLAAGATPDEILAAANQRCTMTVQVAGAPPMYLPRPCGRQSWRQVR
jgi:type IV pilus assembly protein PilY1